MKIVDLEGEKMSRAFLIGAGDTTAQYPNAPLCKNFFGRLGGKGDKTNLFSHVEKITEPYRKDFLVQNQYKPLIMNRHC
jgi:hypothetical protein